MSSLVLRLSGPMQAWGTQSRFRNRDSGLEPSKSGVLGLICAAMGIPRTDDIALKSLAKLTMGVRVDREGRLMRDFQTAGGGDWPGIDQYGVIKADGSVPDTVVSERFYLANAVFLVALSGPRELLERLENALQNPFWPLFLGRKAFPPSEPVYLKNGLREEDLESVLRMFPLISKNDNDNSRWLRLVLECEPGKGQPCMDQPLSFLPGNRRHSVRFVKFDHVNSAVLERGED